LATLDELLALLDEDCPLLSSLTLDQIPCMMDPRVQQHWEDAAAPEADGSGDAPSWVERALTAEEVQQAESGQRLVQERLVSLCRTPEAELSAGSHRPALALSL